MLKYINLDTISGTMEKPFTDFTLVQLDHPDFIGLGFSKTESVVQRIRERLAWGKKLIDMEIQSGRLEKGDLILLEQPQKIKKADYKREYGRTWNAAEEEFFNFYNFLSEYAKSKGLRAESIEPSIRMTGSNLRQEREKRTRSGVGDRSWMRRVGYLLLRKADKFFQSRIQKRKPKMVIVASAHAIRLEHFMKPKRVKWHNTNWNSPKEKTRELRHWELMDEQYLSEKNTRREEAMKSTKFEPKKRSRRPAA